MGNNQGLLKTEDWWSVWLGLFIFILSLGSLAGLDLLGWAVKPNVWMEFSKSIAPASKAYAGLHPLISIILTYLAVMAVLLVGAKALGYNLKKFIYGFTIIFWLTYICTIIGHYAVIAAQTPAEMKKFGLEWSLKLTGEAGLILALLVGLFIGNFMPKFADSLKEAARPEWFIKTAIVIMGVGLGVKSAEQLGLATSMMFRGLCAIIEAYLIYWAVVYLIARKFFKFSREWSAPLASGISICGVSASIATGGAIRARPIVPIMVSSLVVIFAVVTIGSIPPSGMTGAILRMAWTQPRNLFEIAQVAGSGMPGRRFMRLLVEQPLRVGDPDFYRRHLGRESSRALWELTWMPMVMPTRPDCPVLATHGELDRMVPLDSLDAIERYFGADRMVFEAMGHCPMLEKRWEEAASRIAAWLDERLYSEIDDEQLD